MARVIPTEASRLSSNDKRALDATPKRKNIHKFMTCNDQPEEQDNQQIDETFPASPLSLNDDIIYYFSGWIVKLQWRVAGAIFYTIYLDGKEVAMQVSGLIYEAGYWLNLLGAVPGSHQIEIVAYGYSNFPMADWSHNLTLTSEVVSIGNSPFAVAITPDGGQALVLSQVLAVSVIDLGSQPLEVATSTLSYAPVDLAITPDGTRALLTNASNDSVSVLCLGETITEQGSVSVGSSPQGIAITPNGTFALVVNVLDSTVSVLDLTQKVIQLYASVDVDPNPQRIVITPDGSSALVTIASNVSEGPSVDVLDISTIITKASSISSTLVGDVPSGIAITPDGTQALMANWLINNVGIFNLGASISEVDTIPMGPAPQSIAITPDGSLALVINGDYSVGVIPIANASAVANPFLSSSSDPAGITAALAETAATSGAIAITPDGEHLLAVNGDDVSVTLY